MNRGAVADVAADVRSGSFATDAFSMVREQIEEVNLYFQKRLFSILSGAG